MDLRALKKYDLEEAIYIQVFDISQEDLESTPIEDLIEDYTHLKENVSETLDTLIDREQNFLRLVLDDKLSLRLVGEKYGCTTERVRQVVQKAFRKLRHPSRQRMLNGTARKARLKKDTKEKRTAMIEEKCAQIRAEIKRQKQEHLAQMSAQLTLGIESLQLTPECKQKLKALEITTVGELLEKYPYSAKTNGLAGLTVADGIEEEDYYEIWIALFTAGLLMRTPELPDFDTLWEAEHPIVVKHREFRGISIDDLELTIRSYRCLSHKGIRRVGQLLDEMNLDVDQFLAADRQDLENKLYELKIRNISSRSVADIISRLYDAAKELIPTQL